MANTGKDNKGRRFIQFCDKNGHRRMMRLGKMPKTAADILKGHLEQIIHAQITGTATPPATSRWLAEIGDSLLAKLIKFGLAEPPAYLGKEIAEEETLGGFIDMYVASRTDAKPGTRAAWRATHKSLREFFGDDKPLADITKGHAKEWRRSISKGRAENTIRKRTAIAKTLFNAAIDYEKIERNPFDGLKSSMVENKERMYFVSAEETRKVLDACPSTEWQIIFALARYGGLRCPSEVLGLKWSDVLWNQQRFLVRCVKTEHHVGHEVRIVPIFPELAPYLDKAFEEAPEGAEYVVGRARNTAVNLRTHLMRIIERAGLKPWPKLFQNLRSTRETELANSFPIHVVCEWIGNSERVAMKHYLQVTDDHFEAAVKVGKSSKSDTPCDTATLGNAMQRVVEKAMEASEKPLYKGENGESSTDCVFLPDRADNAKPKAMGDTGFEPVTSAV